MNMKSCNQAIIAVTLVVGCVLHAQLSLASPEIVGEIALPETSLPYGVAVDSETGNVYVADGANDQIYIFDRDLNPLGNIFTDEGPFRIAIDPRPETRRLFVGNFTSGTVWVVSLPSGALLCSLPAGPAPHPAFNMATEKLYVGVEGTNTLKIYGGQDSCEFLSELPLGSKPMSLAIDDLTNRVYVAIHHEQYVSVIDGETDNLVTNIALIPQGDPTDVAVNPNNHYVYVAYSQGNAVTEIDTGPSGLGPYEQTNLIVGDGPRFVQVDPGIDRAYVSVINFYQLGIVTAGIVEDPLQLDIIPAFTGVNTKTHCAYTSGDDRVTLRKVLKICDADLNQPPECSGAEPSVDLLWPANHNFVPVDILGVIDPDGDALTITIDSIFQDEAVDAKGSGNTAPDGGGIGTSTADVRAERVGRGNGRVYHIDFTADDGNSGACVGEVTVGVPHDQGQGAVPVDDGALYDSTVDP